MKEEKKESPIGVLWGWASPIMENSSAVLSLRY